MSESQKDDAFPPWWDESDTVPLAAAQRIAGKLGLDFEEFLAEHGPPDPDAARTIPAGTLVAWLRSKIKPGR